MKNKILFIATLFLLIISCTTLPVPKDADDTLLIIPLEHEVTAGLKAFLNYYITIKSLDTEKVIKNILVPRQSSYLKIKGLKPGDYYISGYYSQWTHDKSRNNSHDYGSNFAPFSMEAGKITMAPVGYGVSLIMNNGSRTMRFLQHTNRDGQLQTETFKELEEKYPEELSEWDRTGEYQSRFELTFTNVLNDRELSMTDLKGTIVVIDFWATWCGPCVSEIPNMKALYNQYKDQGVEFIGISLDEKTQTLVDYCNNNGIIWPQYCEEGKTWDTDFSSLWGINSIPRLFLIGKDGKILSRDARGQLETLIPKALADEL